MNIIQVREGDVAGLARLLRLNHLQEEPTYAASDLMHDGADSSLRIDPLGHDDAHAGSDGRVASEALATRLEVLSLRHHQGHHAQPPPRRVEQQPGRVEIRPARLRQRNRNHRRGLMLTAISTFAHRQSGNASAPGRRR